jgi:Holliday junction resolvasome RuvABC endonuclease subunit
MSTLHCIGLDMATRKTGWAVATYDSGSHEITVYETGIAESKADSLVHRAYEIYCQLIEGPCELTLMPVDEKLFGVVESGFVSKNKKTAMDLAFMQGVGAMALANCCAIGDIYLLAPMEIRVSIGFARGAASKAQVAQRVNSISGTDLKAGDEADAAAAAIAGLIGRSSGGHTLRRA